MLIRWASGKAYFIDLLTGDNVPPEYRKILLKAEKEIIKERSLKIENLEIPK